MAISLKKHQSAIATCLAELKKEDGEMMSLSLNNVKNLNDIYIMFVDR